MSLFDNTSIAFESKSDKELKSARRLFKLIGNQSLTKLGAWFFKFPFATDLPFVKTNIKQTIYKQFVGGETPEESLNVANELYKFGVSSILDYSVEGQTEESDFDAVEKVMFHLIDLAKENPSIPFVVFKPTALGDISLFEKVGKNEDLNAEDQKKWENTKRRFQNICKKGFENRVKIMIDAEESWMQDAADELSIEMMKLYNREKPFICNTLQMYRHDRLNYLKTQHELAKNEGYLLNFKIVRGAYMEKERARSEAQSYPSPIQKDKESSDRDYNLAVEYILENLENIALFAGTHNEYSCELLIRIAQDKKIEPSNEHLWFGQLFGMSDNISFNLANLGYNIAKYLPYGPVKEVMPYLVRRAQENTSVAGQTGRELALIDKELKNRAKH